MLVTSTLARFQHGSPTPVLGEQQETAMSSMSIPVHSRLGAALALRLIRSVQAGLGSISAAIAARETERQLAGLDRHTLADIGVPLNGPRSLASRPVWDTAGHGW
jgi:uncharacterized protein YjiS (DUF1127 family)